MLAIYYSEGESLVFTHDEHGTSHPFLYAVHAVNLPGSRHSNNNQMDLIGESLSDFGDVMAAYVMSSTDGRFEECETVRRYNRSLVGKSEAAKSRFIVSFKKTHYISRN